MGEGGHSAEARVIAERGIAEARTAYERTLAAGETAFNTFEDHCAQVMSDAREVAQTLIAGSDVNIRAVFDLAEALARAGSLQEAQALQQAFFAAQTRRMMAQFADIERLMTRNLKDYGDRAARGRIP